MADGDIDQLIQYSIGFADKALEDHGGFYPFASLLLPTGDLLPIGISSDEGFPDSADLLHEYEALLEAKRESGELIAYAIAIDSTITNTQFPNSTDAICIRTFHQQRAQQVNYYFPYHRSESGIHILEGWGENV